jgi:hypothetical protein
MPAYDNSPFKALPKLLVPSQNIYLFGSLNTQISDTKFTITAVQQTTTTGTVTGAVTDGNLPIVGSFISIRGTQAGAGAFNITNALITAVSINPVSGQGTISFTMATGTVATVADSGMAIVPVPEIPEVIAVGASIACAFSANDTAGSSVKIVAAAVNFPTIPTSATVVLQGALRNVDSEFVTLGTVATVAAGAVTLEQAQFPNIMYEFLRLNVTALTGTGTITGKVGA